MQNINEINLNSLEPENFAASYVGAIILTHDNKILLQQRPDNWRSFPGYLATFGGKIEAGETPDAALVRELKEELGAELLPNAATFLGAVTESISDHNDLIYVFFWHDAHASITGCYECEAVRYNGLAEIEAHPKAMQDIIWAIHRCSNLALL